MNKIDEAYEVLEKFWADSTGVRIAQTELLYICRAQQQRIAELEAERDRLQGVLAAHGMEELVS